MPCGAQRHEHTGGVRLDERERKLTVVDSRPRRPLVLGRHNTLRRNERTCVATRDGVRPEIEKDPPMVDVAPSQVIDDREHLAEPGRLERRLGRARSRRHGTDALAFTARDERQQEGHRKPNRAAPTPTCHHAVHTADPVWSRLASQAPKLSATKAERCGNAASRQLLP